MKNILFLFAFLFLSGCEKKAHVDLNDVRKTVYSNNVKDLVNGHFDVMRLSMDHASFAKFSEEHKSKWGAWNKHSGTLYLQTENEGDYELTFPDLLYSVYFREGTGVGITLVWRPDINELWAFKTALLM